MAKLSLRSCLLGSSVLIAANALHAQEAQYLGEVTLLGTGLPTEVLKNPAAITVLGEEKIKKSTPVTIGQLLRDVPGVSVEEQGIERIAIRGEGARRLAIMIDGEKLTDHTNYGQPILVDPTTIERIEVVRGPSSVVSGSRAIGGTINIITKRGADKPFQLSTSAGYFSASRGYRLSTTASGTVDAGAGQLDYRLTLGKMERNDRETPGGTLSPSDMADKSASAHIGYRLDNHYFGLKAQAFDLGANVYTGDPAFIIELPKRDLRKLSAFYEGTDLTPWLTRLSFGVYGQSIERAFNNDVTFRIPFPPPGMNMNVVSLSEDRQYTYGANLRAEMQFTPSSRTVVGLEYEDDQLRTNKSTKTTPGAPFPTLRHDKARIRTFSAFAQHEMDLGNHVTATVGGRWYRVEAEHTASTLNGVAQPLSSRKESVGLASAGLVWSPDDTLALRANISQGYSFPTLGQMFLTTSAGGSGLTVGNPDLKPERATTFELGARMERGGTLLDATLFYTDAQDYIAFVSTGPRTSTYRNVDAARSWGLEVTAEHTLEGAGLTPYVSAAYIQRELHYANGYKTYDSGTPELMGKIGLRKSFDFAQGSGLVDLYIRGESASKFRNDKGVVKSSYDGYATLNLATNWQFDSGFDLTAEVNNITNESYTPSGQLPGAERSFNLFLTKTF